MHCSIIVHVVVVTYIQLRYIQHCNLPDYFSRSRAVQLLCAPVLWNPSLSLTDYAMAGMVLSTSKNRGIVSMGSMGVMEAINFQGKVLTLLPSNRTTTVKLFFKTI